MIDSAKVVFYHPPYLKDFKSQLFDRIGASIVKSGGAHVRDVKALERIQPDQIPMVGCSPECTDLIAGWRRANRTWLYWDRGAFRRIFATGLPPAKSLETSYYRVHLNSFQMTAIRDVPDDRWRALNTDMMPWRKGGRHIVIAAPSRTYAKFHRCENWIADTIDELARVTDRQLVIRDKEHVRNRHLMRDLDGAHALVTHGSIAAVESVVLGTPVFVHPDSAAALVGQTNLSMIEKPVYPDRERWVRSLAYSQWNETELIDGSLWLMLS